MSKYKVTIPKCATCKHFEQGPNCSFCSHPDQDDESSKEYRYYNDACTLHIEGIAKSRMDYMQSLKDDKSLNSSKK